MKRLRASNYGSNIETCLVDGCNSNLRNCRDYYKRHKVCETHSKTLQVYIRGLKQRFCQQCSRFHSLEQFDEGKRSCKKSLDGHNRRRRKPQLDPTHRSKSFFSNFQGSQLFNLSGSHVYPSATITNPSWSAILTSQTNARLYNLQQQLHFPDKQNPFFSSSLVSSYKKGKQFPLLQNDRPSANNQPSATSLFCQPLLNGSNKSSHSMFCSRLTAEQTDRDCALSSINENADTEFRESLAAGQFSSFAAANGP